ncbi:MAG: histidine phosphatase family protein [Actinobacteria bacterium]|nr:histidine phosphatase family protein [Actinomycetota bacterium]
MIEATVFAARHGDVENREGGIYGHLPGFGLSSLGREQAAVLGRALSNYPVSAIYCSPLDRTTETAEIVGALLGIKSKVDERLVEWRFWATVQGPELSASSDEIRKIRDRLIADPDDASYGESLNQFRARLSDWLAEAKKAEGNGLVLGITHFDALRALVLDALGWEISRFRELLFGHCYLVRLHPNPIPTTYDPVHLDELVAQ